MAKKNSVVTELSPEVLEALKAQSFNAYLVYATEMSRDLVDLSKIDLSDVNFRKQGRSHVARLDIAVLPGAFVRGVYVRLMESENALAPLGRVTLYTDLLQVEYTVWNGERGIYATPPQDTWTSKGETKRRLIAGGVNSWVDDQLRKLAVACTLHLLGSSIPEAAAGSNPFA